MIPGASSDADVVVVGAGPAGATAARLLAEAGARVMLLEARRLPRPKLCGGGLTPKAQRMLPPAARATVDRRLERAVIETPGLRPYTLGLPDAPIAMVERAPFDLALAEAAAAAGADVQDGVRVEDVVEREAGVELTLARSRLRAACLVAADGEPSRLAKRLGLEARPRRSALALEVDTPFSERRPADAVILDYRIPSGYAWYFPKGDHANVGIMAADRRDRERLRLELAGFLSSLGLPASGRVQGHWIPLGLRAGPLAGARSVLVGDAAGTADPLYGEGIAYALASAHVAAATIVEWADDRVPDLSAYDRNVRAVLRPPFSRLAFVARSFQLARRASLVTLRLSRWAQTEAIASLTGSAAPFRLDVPPGGALHTRAPAAET